MSEASEYQRCIVCFDDPNLQSETEECPGCGRVRGGVSFKVFDEMRGKWLHEKDRADEASRGYHFFSMCQDGHEQIGWKPNDWEECPVCRVLSLLEELLGRRCVECSQRSECQEWASYRCRLFPDLATANAFACNRWTAKEASE